MRGVRLADRLLALALLAIALLCLHAAYRTFGAGTTGALTVDFPWWAAQLALFAAGGIVGALAAVRLWTGAGAEQSRSPSAAPLFGRAAAVGPGPGKSRLVPLLYIIPLAAAAVVGADYAGMLGTAVGVAVVEQDPPAGDGIAAVGDAETPPAAEAPPPDATAPPAEDEPPTEVVPPAEIVPPGETTAPPPIFAPPPELALPPEIAMVPGNEPPPQTVAPLPSPEPQPSQPEGHRDAVVWLSVARDGHSILSASTDHAIKLWDAESLRLIRTLGAHKDMARTALFLPDGARALTAGDDGEIVLRSLADGAVLHVFSATEHGGARKLAISADGRIAVSVHEKGTVIVWDIEKRGVLHVMAGHGWPISGVAVSPDGRRAVSGSIDGELKLWDIETGRLLRTWLGHERGTYGIAFSPDGHRLLTGSGDFTIKLWDLDAGTELRRFDGHSGTVYALALSTDGERLLSASLDGTARFWDVGTGREITQFNPQTGPLYAVAFAAGGRILTGGIDRAIRVWRVDGGEAVALIPGAPD